jgi:P27 family predicted phage terminase small subunit
MPMPRKSEALHNLQGTTPEYGRETISHIPMSKPSMPEHIKADKASARDWREMVKVLKERGTLTRADGPLIELYCDHRQRRRVALEHLRTEGLVSDYARLDKNGEECITEKRNLWLPIAETCERNIVAVLDRLGIGPIQKDKPRRGVAPKPKPLPVPEPTDDELGLSPLAAEMLKELREKQQEETQND